MSILRKRFSTVSSVAPKARQIILPTIAVAVLVAICAWVTSLAEMRLQKVVRDKLEKVRDATETGLLIWLESREDAAALAAGHDEVVEGAAGVIGLFEGKKSAADIQSSKEFNMLRSHLAGVASRYGTGDFVVIRKDGVTVAANNPSMIGSRSPADMTDAFATAVSGQAIVSRPFLSEFAGKFVGKSDRKVATMFSMAPIHDANGAVLGVLGLRVDPRGRFSGVLQGARLGDSGEAYLVDRAGKLLSMSRFENELVGYGLLEEGMSSVLEIDIRDPKCDLAAGGKKADDAQCELTHMVVELQNVAEDPQEREGMDLGGYANYRGANVVGAWTWLPKHGMGLAVEIDYDEAFAGMSFIRWVLIGAAVLLVLSVGTVSYGSVMVARLRSRVKRDMQLGQYTLEKKIGAGGMGKVYLARHALLRRPTALKVMEAKGTSQDDRARFEKEVQLTSELSHPNTISIYDYGHTPEGVFYYVMEYLEGLDLQTFIQKFGPCPPGRVVRILDQICASLEEAHERGLIHRDIKPANIILCERGCMPDVVKVLDFGLVKELDPQSAALTRNDALSGTPGYLAPEVIRQPTVADQKSDLYCVAAIGYYMLTGQPVFTGKTVMDVLDQHLHSDVIPLSQRSDVAIPKSLELLIMTTLAKNPEQRPKSATEFRLGLKHSGVTWHERLAKSWWESHRATIHSDRERESVPVTEEGEKGLATLEIDMPSWHQSLETQ